MKTVTLKRGRRDPKAKTRTRHLGLLVVVAVVGASLNMGQSDCNPGEPTDRKLYSDFASIEIPYIYTEESDGHVEEPYFVAFDWWATSKNGATGENGAYNVRLRNLRAGPDSPPEPLRNKLVENSYVLLPESIGSTWTVFEDATLPKTLAEATDTHVKIAGLTICGFEDDDANNASGAYNRVKSHVLDQAGPVKAQLREFTMRTVADGFVAPKSAAGIVTGVLGIVADLVPTLIELFKQGPPDPDDFAGCATFSYIGVPHAVLDQMPGGPETNCYAKARDILCPIDARPENIPTVQGIPRDSGVPPQLQFYILDSEAAEPPAGGLDVNPNRIWLADVELRAGVFRTARSAHATHTLFSGTSGVSLPRPSHDELLTSGQQVLDFAHVVDYQTHRHAHLNFDLVPQASGFRADVVGNSPSTNVSVRVSTVTLPPEVQVYRETQTLSSGQTITFWYPEANKPAARHVVIPEILSIQEGWGRWDFEVERFSDRAEVHLQGHRYDNYGDPANIEMTVRMTWLLGDDPGLEAPMLVKRSSPVIADDHDGIPRYPVSQSLDNWFASSVDGANLYYITAFSTGDSYATSYSVRAVGAEFLEYVTGTARLFAQHNYEVGYGTVVAEIVNISF